jgi:flavin reductase (DIM6/NTAB) family NADH-FMN oxidoreductase RutF
MGFAEMTGIIMTGIIRRRRKAMERKHVEIENLGKSVTTVFKDWMLLTAGEFGTGKFNAMTIGWGFWGFAWGRPTAIVLVRHQRYTYEFMEKYGDFTVCSFARKYRRELSILGTKSGRDCDKMKEAGLTPVASKCVLSPSYEEADFVLECKKVHTHDLVGQEISADYIRSLYNGPDELHKLYFGEIVNIEEALPGAAAPVKP